MNGAVLTSVSEPSLLVKAASLKHIMQTAFSLITLSALGTRSRMEPNGCACVYVDININLVPIPHNLKKKWFGKPSQTVSQQEGLTV